MENKIEVLTKMLTPDYDWNSHWDNGGYDRETILKSVFTYMPEKEVETKYGGYDRVRIYRIDDTPKVLYRFLYVFGAQFPDFVNDMYKSSIGWLTIEDQSILINAYLFKYELTFYMYTRKEMSIPQNQRVDQDLWDWETYCTTDENAIRTFEAFAKTMQTEFKVYPGNDFKV